MPQFKVENVKELKAFLYDSCFHDATFKNIDYDYASGKLMIEAFNCFFNCKWKLDFSEIETIFVTKGNWLLDRSEEISSLTVEDDFSYLKEYVPKFDKTIDEFLYLVFQMFTGDEIHIVCKEVAVEKNRH